MRYQSTPAFSRQLNKLTKKYHTLPNILDKKLKLFLENPDHPSLRLHKLTGNLGDHWSLSITKDIRVLFRYTNEGILFTCIGTHDEVY